MTTLTIEQGNNIEIVPNAVILKLYETALNSTNVTLSGNLQCDHCFENAYDYLTGYVTEGVKRFPNLAINVTDGKYVSFADPEVNRILSNLWGDGTGITAVLMAAKTELIFADIDSVTGHKPFISNTTVRTFNELGRFTTIKTIGTQTFERSYIESIDLSNIEYINWSAFTGTHLTGTINLPSIKKLGAGTGTQLGDCFSSNANITNVICGPNLELLGLSVFKNCTSLQTVTGLSNLTTMANECFYGCTALTSVDLNTNVTFGLNLFEGCSNLENIGTWVNNTVTMSPTGNQRRTFYNCQKLEFPEELTIEFESNTGITRDVGAFSFYNCKKLKKVILSGTNLNLGKDVFDESGLTLILGTENIKYIGQNIFYGTNISGTLNLINCIGGGSRNNGSDVPSLQCILGNVPGITKVILGDWSVTFNKGSWNFNGEYRSVFDNCSGLTTVDFKSMYNFPNTRFTTIVRSGFFYRCPNMTTFIIRQESVVPLQIDDIVHPNDIGGPNVTLYVPDSVVNDYKTAAGWSNIANQIRGISELPS